MFPYILLSMKSVIIISILNVDFKYVLNNCNKIVVKSTNIKSGICIDIISNNSSLVNGALMY